MTARSAFDLALTLFNGSVNVWRAADTAGLLAWNVRTVPLLADLRFVDAEGRMPRVPGRLAVVREDTAVLGTTGVLWKPQRLEDYLDTIDGLTDPDVCRISHAGELDAGRRALVVLNAGDARTHLSITFCYDGATASYVQPWLVIAGALIPAGPPHPFRTPEQLGDVLAVLSSETSDVRAQFDDVRDGLRLAPSFRAWASRFYGMAGSDESVRPSDARLTRETAKLDRLVELFVERGDYSRTGALVAVCRYEDHHAPVRGAGDLIQRRARRAILRPEIKRRAVGQLGLA